MKPLGRTQAFLRWGELAIRLVVGGVFLYAGAVKISNPLQLADSIWSFQILPRALVTPLALGLPPFEILAGAMLVAGWRVGALAVAVATAIFSAAFASTLARGIAVDCGCFGGGSAPATLAGNLLELLRDLVILAAALAVYVARLGARNERRGA
jgi:putative oxidoreductase